MSAATPLLEVEDLRVGFPVRSGLLQRVTSEIRAVAGISFQIARGEVFGLVGESGCGKTTVARTVLRLLEPSSGTVRYEGEDIATLSGVQLTRFRRKVQAIFQDPFSSLNPRMTAGGIIGEPIRVHGVAKGSEVAERVARLLDLCGLPRRFAELYPHEMSGGQRQRVGIARSLVLQPEFIVCDEAVSALDVSIQAQIVNLLSELKRELGLTYLFIGHDLSGFSRILYGTRISLFIGISTVVIALVIGVTLGIVAGYFGGWIDLVIMRYIDLQWAFPNFIIAVYLVAVFGTGLSNVIVAISLAFIDDFARVARSMTLSVREEHYIDAARTLGFSDARILFVHILPNATAPIIVQATVSISYAILGEASLSFLGLGVDANTPTWGLILADGRGFISQAWWLGVFPGLAIMLVVLSINFLGDWLRDVLDVRQSS